jgi:hypothetical protein
MDKLTRYNQKLLAIIGTMLLIATAGALLIGIGAFIVSIIEFNDTEVGIKVNDHTLADIDSTSYTRYQEICYDSPVQVDSAQALFIIPVGQINRETRQKYNSEDYRIAKSSANEFYGFKFSLYNNFVLYDNISKESKNIFDELVAISRWQVIEKDKSNYALAFIGANTDSNSDKKIDRQDFQIIYIYYLSDRKLMKYSFQGKTVTELMPMRDTDLISIMLGVDSDNNLKYSPESEPNEIVTLNLETRNISEIVPTKLKFKIQSLIDGIDQ